MNIKNIEQKLEKLVQNIYIDALKEQRNNYKVYEDMLNSVYTLRTSQIISKNQRLLLLLANGYYNLSKITNRPKYIRISLQITKKSTVWVLWSLQMIALTSARGSHEEAHAKAVQLIQIIVGLIDSLELEEKHLIFVREIKELIVRKVSLASITNQQMFKQFQTGPKFTSKCPLITKKFHIADIMAMQALQPQTQSLDNRIKPQQNFFLYVVYLSIACFTRATQKFYCHETDEKDFHFKAIQIASYVYEQKSTYLRFLHRTYFEHYKQALEKIDEEYDLHELYRQVQKDPKEISMVGMPWESEQEEIETQLFHEETQNQEKKQQQ